MKRMTKHIGVLLTALLAGGALTSCQNDFDAPGMNIPVASLQPNTTIAELKSDYWNDADNYIDEISLSENGEHKIIAGRVVSSDASGNIYKNLVIQDETGALTMSINANSLYNNYRIGQEIVVDVTEMYIGKYSTLQQLGFPEYSPAYGWQATFMPLEFFKQHIQLNGLPEPSKVDTLTINLGELGTDAANMQKYQSRLVRINNVKFEEGGEASFCTAHKVNTNRTLKDANGNTLIVRTSGYANYWSAKLPAENGDVVGILSTYKSGGTLQWQLLMRSTDDLLNFGNPTLPKGTEDNPYDIAEAIAMTNSSSAVSGWFTGYIVGSVKGGTEAVTTDEDILWGDEAEVASNLVIGQTPEATSLSECVLLSLPQGSPLREYGNLRDTKENYKKQIWVLATPGEELGMPALTKNNGAANTWRIEGVDVPGGDTPGGAVAEGDGSESKPYNATQVLAKGKSVSESGKWVSGYIVGYIPDKYLDGALFTVPATSATNILLATTPDETDYSKCLPIQLPQGNVRASLNLMDNPGNHKQLCSVYGNLMAYFGVAGVKETSDYKINGSGPTTPDVPSEAVNAFSENFDAAASFPTASGFTIKETSGNASWFIRKADNNNPTNCAEVTAYGNGKTAGADGFISWMISCPLNVDAMSEKVLTFKSKVGYTGNGTLEVYALSSNDPATATKTKLNANIPQPTGSWGDYVESGNVSLAGLSGTVYIGFCYTAAKGSNYTTYRIEDVVAGTPGEGGNTGGGNEGGDNGGNEGGDNGDDDGGEATYNNTADFHTLAAKSSYSTYTTTAGWVVTNCAVQSGGAKDANPVFTFIGDSDAVKAVCVNGKVSAPGTIVSPTLTGGIKALKFNYGFAFSDKQCKFTVNIKQNGAVVATKTMDITSITKFEVCEFTMDCNVSGDFVIEIVNDCKTGTDKNVDRVSIWNLVWANM